MKFKPVITPLIPMLAALFVTTAVTAQTTTPAPTDTTPPAAAPATPTPAPANPSATEPTATAPMPTDTASRPILSDEQAKSLKNKVVWSSDQKNVGEVAEIVRDPSGRVTELHADIGGFLGFGETRVRVMADEFNIVDDRVVLTRTAEQAKTLPKMMAN